MNGLSLSSPLPSEDRTRVRWLVRLVQFREPRFGESRHEVLVWEVVPYLSNRAGRRVFGEPRAMAPYRSLPAAHTKAMRLAAEYRARRVL